MEEKRVFSVSGMHCAGCAAAVEKVMKKFPVRDVYVNFASGRLAFTSAAGVPSDDEVIEAVKKAGFKAELPLPVRQDEKFPEWKRQLTAFFCALFFTAALLVVCFGHIPSEPVVNGVLQFGLLIPVLIAGNGFFRRGVPAIFRGVPNMDSLISCGASAGIIYSIILLFAEPGAHLYFDASAMILTLVMLGKMLESRSRHYVSSAVSRLLALTPPQAHLIGVDGQTKDVPCDELQKGDLVRILPGEKIPADAVVRSGSGFVNESMLTGEELPAVKNPGDRLFGGTLNSDGVFQAQISSTGADAMLGQIVELISRAQNSRPPVSALADKVSGIFVWLIFGIAALTALIWGIAGNAADVLHFTLSVLVVACPCALGLAVPIALIAGIGRGARSGILIKSGSALESAAKIRVVIFDKTGTLTSGLPQVNEICAADPFTETGLLTAAAAVEKLSSHPLAGAIVAEAENQHSVSGAEVENFAVIPGRGVQGTWDGKFWMFGNIQFMQEHDIAIPEAFRMCSRDGNSRVYGACGGIFAGCFAISDTIRPEAEETIRQLHSLGIRCAMLTGDNFRAGEVIAEELHLDSFAAELLPRDKVAAMQKIREEYHAPAAMVGDGINDAPVLAAGDLGIAIGSGSNIALESAGVILPGNNLKAVVQLIRLSRAAFRVIRQNLFWAFFYNFCAIPVAAGITYVFWGIRFNPAVCAGMMAASSLCVVLNSLRLLAWKK